MQDGKTVLWGATIRYLLIRGVAAGLVATAIIIVAGMPWQQWERLAAAGVLPPLFPPLYLLPLAWPALVFLCFGVLCLWGKMAQIMGQITAVPVIYSFGSLILGLGTLAAILACAIGDPLVWLLNKFFPQLVNLRDLPFINFHLFIYVYDN